MANWQDQLERVRRYYLRFKRLNDGKIHSNHSENYVDDIYAFFQNCYHLKDHLKNDPAYNKHTNQQIENHVKNTQALAICADICNGSKHLMLNRSPRSGSRAELGKKNIKLQLTDTLSTSEPGYQNIPVKIHMQVEVEHGSNKLDAFQLATDALLSWERFIT